MPKTTTHPQETRRFRGPWDRVRAPLDFRNTVSMAKQSHRDECDINYIMKRAERTGVVDFQNKHQPQYGDCSGLEFQSAMETVANAQAMFDDLPARIRDRFQNDPAQFLNFIDNPENRAEALEIGLIADPRAEAPPANRRATDAPVSTPAAQSGNAAG